jgi:hypothetical protein
MWQSGYCLAAANRRWMPRGAGWPVSGVAVMSALGGYPNRNARGWVAGSQDAGNNPVDHIGPSARTSSYSSSAGAQEPARRKPGTQGEGAPAGQNVIRPRLAESGPDLRSPPRSLRRGRAPPSDQPSSRGLDTELGYRNDRDRHHPDEVVGTICSMGNRDITQDENRKIPLPRSRR